jgi:hypothetical protein
VSIDSSRWIVRALIGTVCFIAGAGGLKAQADTVPPPTQHSSRIFGILPNYFTFPGASDNVEPMSSAEKWRLATKTSFDPSTFLVAGVFAGIGQAEHQFPSWGQGAKGMGRRFSAAVADQVVVDYLTGAVFPILLHQDPRYFRMEHGSFIRRFGYAVGRIVITRTDTGAKQVNYSEFFGDAAAAGISNAYIPVQDRTFGATFQKFTAQLATDAFFNVLKEFWPDIRDKLFHGSGRGGAEREQPVSQLHNDSGHGIRR